MSLTSAQSGENYRNWWPQPAMMALTNHSIDLTEEIARDSNNRIHMNRRGYALVTRKSNIDALMEQLHDGLGDNAQELLRYHATTNSSSTTYHGFGSPKLEDMLIGVDVLQNKDLIRTLFPHYDPEIESIIHIRRGGDISGQQLGMYMVEHLRETNAVTRVVGDVQHIETNRDGRFFLCNQYPAAMAPHKFYKPIDSSMLRVALARILPSCWV